MTEEIQALGGTAIKPVGWDRTGWEAFKYLLYDSDNGTILSRTPLSWLKITVFYIIYYSFLTAFWIACLVIFFQTLPPVEDGPRWTQDSALIGSNPGVGLRPRNSDLRIDSQMFVLKEGDENLFPSEREGEGDLNSDYAARVTRFFQAYKNTPSPAKNGFKGYTEFDTSSLGFCGTAPYGYVGKSVTPCIFFKLNNIWGWFPKPVECGSPEEVGSDGEPKDSCPPSLVNHMKSEAGQAAGTDNIWIDCHGRNAADKEALDGGFEFFPKSRALPIDYFPYTGPRNEGNATVGYHSPLVAAKISPRNGNGVPGQLLHIECRAYFRGVIHNTRDKIGLVQFEVQVHD